MKYSLISRNAFFTFYNCCVVVNYTYSLIYCKMFVISTIKQTWFSWMYGKTNLLGYSETFKSYAMHAEGKYCNS